MERAPNNQINSAEVKAALARLVESSAFKGSPQLVKFIQYVVDASLNGKAETIKSYAIGVDVLGRSEDFNPQIDPIVRVEARRLRQALQSYYTGPGAEEPIRIEIPLGSYVPVFRQRSLSQNNSHEKFHAGPPKLWRRFSKKSIGIFCALLAINCIIFAALYLPFDRPDNAETLSPLNDVRPYEIPNFPKSGMPTLYVDPIHLFVTDSNDSRMNADLRRDLLDVFSRFDAVNISPIPHERMASNIIRASHDHHMETQFFLTTAITNGASGLVEVSFQLLDADSNELIWSKDFKVNRAVLERGEGEMTIAATAGAELLGPYGVISTHESHKMADGTALDPRYVCILDTFDAFRSFENSKLAKARGCLEALTGPGDNFAAGLPYLAAVYNRMYLFGDDVAAGNQATIDLALDTARRGAELSPSSARAYQSLLVALFNHKDVKEAFEAGRRAFDLNPYDPSILWEYGGRLILNGDIDHGLAIMRKGYRNGTTLPAMYHYFMFLGHYFKGNFSEASEHADQLPETYAFRYLAQTLIAVAYKNNILARKNYDHLSRMQPRFAKDPRAWLTRFFTDQSLVDRIVSALSDAELVTSGVK